MNRQKIFAVCALGLIFGGTAWLWHQQNTSLPLQTPLKGGVGTRLEHSNSVIKVLGEGQPTSDVSGTSLPTETEITLQSDAPTAPAVFDPVAAQLGTTISLLVNSWQQGGGLPHQLANTASLLAEQSGQKALAEAAQSLRSNTPREGPITLSLLLVETRHMLDLPPPANLPEDDQAAEEAKSWFRLQLEKLIDIRSTPATQNRWSTSLATVEQTIARGTVTDALQVLTSAPLSKDERLDNLRIYCKAYLSQVGKLNRLVTTYANTYLVNKE